jgi:osmotically-inducible protein OsmY
MHRRRRVYYSNDNLSRAAYRALDQNAGIPKGAIYLVVYGGFVRLFGKVDWSYERAAAISTVKKVAGVLGVQDQIRVQTDG